MSDQGWLTQASSARSRRNRQLSRTLSTIKRGTFHDSRGTDAAGGVDFDPAGLGGGLPVGQMGPHAISGTITSARWGTGIAEYSHGFRQRLWTQLAQSAGWWIRAGR